MAGELELIFVYNADSGLSNALIDYGKKITQPSKYDCQLCMVTYGPFGKKSDWKKFINNLNASVKFLHRDEFVSEFGKTNSSFPCLLKKDGDKLGTLITSEQFKEISSLEELIAAVTESTKT